MTWYMAELFICIVVIIEFVLGLIAVATTLYGLFGVMMTDGEEGREWTIVGAVAIVVFTLFLPVVIKVIGG